MMYAFKRRVDKQKGVDSNGMDIGEVAEWTRKLKEEIERTEQFKQDPSWAKGSSPDTGPLNNEDNRLNEQLNELYQVLKGNGKGETRTCYIRGQTGHLAKHCWQKNANRKEKVTKEDNFGKGKGFRKFGKGYIGGKK